jgi:carboxymethylenebutenolidase
MNIFPPSISKWSEAGSDSPRLQRIAWLWRGLALLGTVQLGFLFLSAAPPSAQKVQNGRIPPFLEEFKRNTQPGTRSRNVTFPSALGSVKGVLARPDTSEQLPAILLIHDEAGLTDWMKQNASELSTFGYDVLALDLAEHVPGATAKRQGFREDEPLLAKLSAAVRWLRRQPDVMPERIGVVGWSWGGGQALALAASVPLQACVLCYGPVSAEAGVLAGLRRTPVLSIFAAGDDASVQSVRAFRQALISNQIPNKIIVHDQVAPGFMGPPGSKAYVEKAAEDTWVELYEFLGKYVEDADLNLPVRPAPSHRKSMAGIADIMRSVNNPTGVRGALLRALAQKPESAQAWRQVRADAVLLVEATRLLADLRPPKGAQAGWQKRVAEFQELGVGIATAATRQDYAVARRGVEELSKRCAACHKNHR